MSNFQWVSSLKLVNGVNRIATNVAPASNIRDRVIYVNMHDNKLLNVFEAKKKVFYDDLPDVNNLDTNKWQELPLYKFETELTENGLTIFFL